jgi:5-hydroxyisourate hydrolase-like protein (transthyretin family)
MKKLLLMLAFSATGFAAYATSGTEKQKTVEPAVAGTVLDATTKKPVADVVVTATHTTGKSQHTITTDANGQFKLPQLPAGTYKFRFEKANYVPVEKSSVTVKQESPVKINIEIADNDQEEDRRQWFFKYDF